MITIRLRWLFEALRCYRRPDTLRVLVLLPEAGHSQVAYFVRPHSEVLSCFPFRE